MRRPLHSRHALIALICDVIDSGTPYFCLFAVRSGTAHQYGLNEYTTQRVLSGMKNSGLVSEPKNGFYLPTSYARALLSRYPFSLVCEWERPCAFCIRAGLAEEPTATGHTTTDVMHYVPKRY